MVLTRVELRVRDPRSLLEFLQREEPQFREVESERPGQRRFSFTRAYPKGHWNPLSRIRGARQILGELTWEGDLLTIETRVASIAALCVQRLEQGAPESFSLHQITWTGAQELLKSIRNPTPGASECEE
jgi:hypothetical protein